MKKECKFKSGDIVSHPPDLYGSTKSIVTHIEKFYQEGPDELVHAESDVHYNREDIHSRIEEIDGVEYFIHDGNEKDQLKPCKAPFAGWLVHTENNFISSIWNEKSLRRE